MDPKKVQGLGSNRNKETPISTPKCSNPTWFNWADGGRFAGRGREPVPKKTYRLNCPGFRS